ncbi:hypothetical protein ABIB73_006943 [Bradyrhizobium sp. F1.4.3]
MAPQRQREASAGPGRRLAVTLAAFRQQARPQAAFHPDVREAGLSRRREPALPSEQGLHLEPVFRQPGERLDVRVAWCPEPALPSEQGLHPEPVFLQPGERRDVRVACCPEPALRTARVWLSGPEASPGEPPVRQVSERASPSAQAVPQGPLTAALLPQAEVSAGQPDAPVLPRAASAAVSVHAAVGPQPEAVVSVRAAAEPQPAAASEPWAQQVLVEAAEVSDGLRVAAAVASDVTAQQPAAARREDAAVLPPAAVRSGVPARQAEAALSGARRAAVPSAAPLEAASVFRQGPSLLSGPARPQGAARFAHAMRCLRIVSRS